jgi:hypothetical protein
VDTVKISVEILYKNNATQNKNPLIHARNKYTAQRAVSKFKSEFYFKTLLSA